jgi:predicted acetyltransferase
MGISPRTPNVSELEDMIVMTARVFSPYGGEEHAIRHIMTNPLYDISAARVIDADGRIVSALQILPREMLVRGAPIPMGGISCVATEPEYRKRGYAGALCVDSIHRMHERGLCTSALMPFSYEYYGKFGWCEAGGGLAYESSPNDLPAYAEASCVRPAEEGDMPAAIRLQAEARADRTGYFVRTERWWEVNRDFRVGRIAVFERGGVGGYIGYKLIEGSKRGEDVTPGHVRVCELVAASDDAARGLCGFLRGFADHVEVIRWNTDAAGLRASTLDRYPHSASWRPTFMYRVVDLVGALRPLFDGGAPIAAPLEIRVRDEVGTWNESGVWVTPEGVSTKPIKAAPRIEPDIRHFSQLHIGYRTATDLASLGLLKASEPQALELAEALFPRQDPFFPDPDWF